MENNQPPESEVIEFRDVDLDASSDEEWNKVGHSRPHQIDTDDEQWSRKEPSRGENNPIIRLPKKAL
jgi:hypothetical protein